MLGYTLVLNLPAKDSVSSSSKTGLRKKIVTAMVLLALLPVLVGLFVTSWKGTTELRKAIGNNFEGLAKEAANKTDLAIQKEISELRHVGSSNEVQKALLEFRSFSAKHPAQINASFLKSSSIQKALLLLNRNLRDHEPSLQFLALTNDTGLLLADTFGAPTTATFLQKEPWWRENAEGGPEAVFLGSIYTNPNEPEFYFDMAIPIFQNENHLFLGVLKASYNLKTFLKPFIYGIRFGATGHAMLIDSEGIVLICPILPTGSHVTDPELVKSVTSSKHSGWITAPNDGHGGKNSIVGFAPVEAVNHLVSIKGEKEWHSFIRQDPAETYTPVQSLLATVLVSGALLVGFTCVLGFMVSGKLVKPLLLLREGAEQIRKGDLGHRLQIKTNDEIEALADKFNEMAQNLSELYGTLEQKVAMRTYELQSLNQIATTLNQSLELQDLLNSTLEKMIEVTSFESGYIELFEPENERLTLQNHLGLERDLVAQLHASPQARQFSREAIDKKGPVIFETLPAQNVQQESAATAAAPSSENILQSGGYQSIISVPIHSKDKIVGAFTLASRKARSFTPQDLELLSSIGAQLGTAVENAYLYQKEQESVGKLMEMDRIKTEFLSNISHELRIPLTSIIGFSELLLDRVTGPLAPDQESYIKNMNTSGHHLLEIINNLLDLSKIKAGKMEVHPHPFSLAALIDSVKQTVIPMTYKKQIRFETVIQDEIDFIHTDEAKLKQILLNILGNAVKFTPAKGEVTLTVKKSSLNQAPALEISVHDTGIGIPENAIEKIFDEFQQVDGSYTRDYPGTGLGLAITKRFVEFLEGDIRVQSRVGAGTVFTISLPFLEAPKPPATPIPESVPFSAPRDTPYPASVKVEERPKILIVEDDPAVSKLLALYLTQEGYSVAHAYDGEEAIEKAQEMKPFAITLDIMLPRMDGWEVLKRLKTLPATRDIPVIIISITENPTLGFSLGAVDYFTKPIDRKGLIKALKKHSLAGSVRHKPMNLLIIEQDPEVMEQMNTFLSQERFGVIKTTRGLEGVALAIEIQPDLILLDLMTQDLSAFEIIHRIKQHPTAKNIPILLFAPRDLTTDEKRVLDGQVREIIYQGPSLKDTLIQEVRKFEKLYPDKAKMVDGLTGLYNERYLQNKLSDEVNRAFRYKRTFSLVLTNVDHFRQVNRRYGAEAGDHILRSLSILLRTNTRSANPLCRCGGSAFAIILPETAKEPARVVGEKLRRLTQEFDFSISEKEPLEPITISAGISTFFEDAETSEKMIIQAGAALSLAKKEGGNRTRTLNEATT